MVILQEVTKVPTPAPTPEPSSKEPPSPVRTPDLSEHLSTALSPKENHQVSASSGPTGIFMNKPNDSTSICKSVSTVVHTSVLPLSQVQIEILWVLRLPHRSHLPPGWPHPLLLQPIRAQIQPASRITHGEEQSSPWRRKYSTARGRNSRQHQCTSKYCCFILLYS